MPYVHITASPRGHRCGLFHYVGAGKAITVLVLPKMWSGQRKSRISVDEHSLILVLYELDKVVVEVDQKFADWLCVEVRRSIDDSVRRAQAKKENERLQAKKENERLQAKKEKPPAATLNDAVEEDEEDDCDAILNELVTFSPTKDTASPTEFSGGPDVQQSLLSLIYLASRCRRSTNIWGHDADATEGSGGVVGELGERRNAHDPLALLAQWLFVEQMEARIRKVRRGYIPIVETSCFLRGRPTTRGMLEQAAMGAPWIECARDEFTEATPLYRVLVTALEHVATGAIAAQFGLAGWSVAEVLAKKAVRVRRLLSAIPTLPIPVAANDAGRIRLTRLQREWERPLELARQILRVEPPKTGVAGEGAEAIQWWFDTSKLWEDVVAQALKGAWERVDEQGSKEKKEKLTVWTGVGATKRPDMVVSEPFSGDHKPRTVVIDAKYKGVSGTAIKVGADDQYQAFAYSMLRGAPNPGSQETAPPAHDTVALVFPLPTISGGARASVPVHLKPAPRGPVHAEQGPACLLRVGLPFPSHNDILSSAAWQEYLKEVGQALSSGKLPRPT